MCTSFQLYSIQNHKSHIILLQEIHLVRSQILALKRAFIGHAFHSMNSNYARGVSVLVAKSPSCTPKTIVTDPFESFVVLFLIIDRQRTQYFCCSLCSTTFTIAVWEVLMAKVLQVAESLIFLAGDLNTVLYPHIDRLCVMTRCSSPLEACMSYIVW